MPNIDQALITQFSEMVHYEAEQMKPRMKPYTETKQMTGDDWAYDSLGSVQDKEILAQYEAVVFDDIDHTRRQISRRAFNIALPIDNRDSLGMIVDPTQRYAKRVAESMMRRYDRVALGAALADVKTGRNFENTVTAAQDGVLAVSAAGGASYESLVALKRNFMGNEVGNDMKVKLALTITEKEHDEFMKEDRLTSGDFSRNYVVDEGEIVKGAGIDFIPYGSLGDNPVIPAAVGGVRPLIALAEGGLCVGISQDMTITVEPRYDLVNTWQVVANYILGAVRTEGVLVQELTADV